MILQYSGRRVHVSKMAQDYFSPGIGGLVQIGSPLGATLHGLICLYEDTARVVIVGSNRVVHVYRSQAHCTTVFSP